MDNGVLSLFNLESLDTYITQVTNNENKQRTMAIDDRDVLVSKIC